MLLSELKFFSFLCYTPGVYEVNLMRSLKLDKRIRVSDGKEQDTTEILVHALKQVVPENVLLDIFPQNAILVPVPPSSKIITGGLWVPYRIANALLRNGYGRRVIVLLSREYSVRKSATSVNRPTAKELFDSLSVNRLELDDYSRIVLVDDVITRGANSLAAASRLHEAFPESDISSFAMLRTISNKYDFVNRVAPVSGIVSLRYDGQTFRRP